MSTATPIATKIFVNLPVKDLGKSVEFFTGLGFSFDERFTNDKAAGMTIGENIHAMLLVEEFFASFTGKEIADTGRTIEVINALGVESRERVDELVDRALASGGSPANESVDEGSMYLRSFQDLDGHIWEVTWMDPAFAGQS